MCVVKNRESLDVRCEEDVLWGLSVSNSSYTAMCVWDDERGKRALLKLAARMTADMILI